MKEHEIDALTSKHWIINFLELNPGQLTAEIIRRKGGQWYRLSSGEYLLAKDLGDYFIPGCQKIDWPDPLPENYILDSDSFPDWGRDSSRAIQLALEFRDTYGDPYRLNLETDEQGHRRWLAIFRKSHAYAWGNTPAEALCRAYLLAYEILND